MAGYQHSNHSTDSYASHDGKHGGIMTKAFSIIFYMVQIVFCVAAFGLIIANVWLKLEMNPYKSLSSFTSSLVFWMPSIVGLCLLGIPIFAMFCVGFRMKVFTIAYLCILVLLIVLQVTILLKSEYITINLMSKASDKWTNASDEAKVDFQQIMHCCGFKGPDDRVAGTCPKVEGSSVNDTMKGCSYWLAKPLEFYKDNKMVLNAVSFSVLGAGLLSSAFVVYIH